jgi:hypothetical protein
MSAALSIIDALDDPALLAPFYSGDSWATWRSVLKAAYALPLTDVDLERFHAVAGDRNPPSKPVRELWIVAGRRAGKDAISAAIAVYAAVFGNHGAFIRSGETPVVMCLAVDRDQARGVLGYIRAMLQETALLKPLIVGEDAESITLSTGVEIAVHTNSYRSVRGRTILMAILDECAFYRSEDSATPDRETYAAVIPGMATLPEAMLIGISSPHKRSGLLYDKWKDHFGRDDDNLLVIHAPTLVLNPTVDPKVIDDALVRDPQAAAAEWLAEWRDDISGFLDGAWIDRAASLEPGELPPRPGIGYHAFLDPSGGRHDAMTLGVAHRDGDRVVIDLVRGRRPPFDPQSVVVEFAELMHAYGISRVPSDRYAGEWVASSFRRFGVTVIPAEKSKSEIYLEAEPLFAQGSIAIPAHRTLLAELRQLERRTHRGGRDTVDHPVAGKDDHANACCGAAWLCGIGVGKLDGWLRYYERLAQGHMQGGYVVSGSRRPGSPVVDVVLPRRHRAEAAPALAPSPFLPRRAPPAPLKTYTLCSRRPWECFCTSDGVRYRSGEDRLLTNVPEKDREQLINMGCSDVAGADDAAPSAKEA